MPEPVIPSMTPVPVPLRPSKIDPRPLAEFAARVGAAAPPEPAARVLVTGVTHRSDDVHPGDLYAALPGARTHGAKYAASAVAHGAVAILTDPAGVPEAAAAGVPVLSVADPRAVLGEGAALVYGEPAAGLTLLGVTGTSGKTTTVYLLEAGLRAGGRTTGLVGTVETRIAGEVARSGFTTPEAPDLQAIFAVMGERGVDAVAMEVSSHALAMGRVGGTRFAVGGFSNLSQDHLDFHADLEDYFQAKAMLFDGRCDVEVVNVDDPAGRRLVHPRTVTVSAEGDESAAWRATGIGRADDGGSQFLLHPPNADPLPVTVAIPGRFNVANAVLAFAMLDAAGVPPRVAAEAIATVAVPGRMERIDAGQPYLAVVDYSHKPAAVTGALATLREVTAGRLVCVLGCGGDRDRGKRPLMGEAGALGADLLIVTDDNPRSEDAAAIRAAMLAGALAVPDERRGEVVEIGDRAAAIAEAVRRAGPGDTVLVAGKGHEQGQVVGDVVHPFDDRVVLRKAILAENE